MLRAYTNRPPPPCLLGNFRSARAAGGSRRGHRNAHRFRGAGCSSRSTGAPAGEPMHALSAGVRSRSLFVITAGGKAAPVRLSADRFSIVVPVCCSLSPELRTWCPSFLMLTEMGDSTLVRRLHAPAISPDPKICCRDRASALHPDFAYSPLSFAANPDSSMTTLLFTHPAASSTIPHLPPRVARPPAALLAALDAAVAGLDRRVARAAISRICPRHPIGLIERVLAAVPASVHAGSDADTVLSPARARRRCTRSARCAGGRRGYGGEATNAFCACGRPATTPSRCAMGFCLFNNIAIAAAAGAQV